MQSGYFDDDDIHTTCRRYEHAHVNMTTACYNYTLNSHKCHLQVLVVQCRDSSIVPARYVVQCNQQKAMPSTLARKLCIRLDGSCMYSSMDT